MNVADAAIAAFRRAFGVDPTSLALAPGRVELLGNHTDYNGGLVLAAAIDRHTAVAARPAPGGRVRAYASGFDARDDFELSEPRSGNPGSWATYVRGVTWAVQQDYGPCIDGLDIAICGDIPQGAGLSSSASLQAAVGLVLGVGVDGDEARMRLARVLRRSENEFVGVASGLLDQFSVLMGRDGFALSLDCRSLEYERVSLSDPAPAIVVCDTKTSRLLADGMYNRRRAESDRVVDHFRQHTTGVKIESLRDLTLEKLMDDWHTLDDPDRRRARHVLTENERVRRGVIALKEGKVAEFGRLMSASHASSRDDFDNSSPALDAMVESAEGSPGFLGGKLSGAGWAGCTVNLVEAAHAVEFAAAVAERYERRTGVAPAIHVCRAAEGAHLRALDSRGDHA